MAHFDGCYGAKMAQRVGALWQAMGTNGGILRFWVRLFFMKKGPPEGRPVSKKLMKSRWWRELDSNQRSLRHQIYSLAVLTTHPSLHGCPKSDPGVR